MTPGEGGPLPATLPLRRSTRHQTKPTPVGAGTASHPILISDSPESKRKEKAHTDDVEREKDDKTPPPAKTTPTKTLPSPLPSRLAGLTKSAANLLHAKQVRLKSPASQVHRLHEFSVPGSREYEGLRNAVAATLVFAQEEAGTAVCIHPSGLLLTCSHCVAETAADLDLARTWYLLFSNGVVVCAKTIKWDPKLDLALLQITASQSFPSSIPPAAPQSPVDVAMHSALSFPHLPISPTPPALRTPLHCIGHPGSEDLEATVRGLATGYDVLHVSSGRFRGYAPGQDRCDNSEIGALMHDCWTYWGHSGAPLVGVVGKGRGGGGGGRLRLVGLHSSWDDETGMRRGVGVEGICGFVGEYLDGDGRDL